MSAGVVVELGAVPELMCAIALVAILAGNGTGWTIALAAEIHEPDEGEPL
jgi:hypothetical protein